MPESVEIAPLVSRCGFWGTGGEHIGGELGCVVGDFVEVSVLGFHALTFFAGVALAIGYALTEGGE